MFVLRIQFIGEKAKEIMQDQDSSNPKHPETLRRVLNELSIPYPDHIRPVWKSGVIMCQYSAAIESVGTAAFRTSCLSFGALAEGWRGGLGLLAVTNLTLGREYQTQPTCMILINCSLLSYNRIERHCFPRISMNEY